MLKILIMVCTCVFGPNLAETVRRGWADNVSFGMQVFLATAPTVLRGQIAFDDPALTKEQVQSGADLNPSHWDSIRRILKRLARVANPRVHIFGQEQEQLLGVVLEPLLRR